MDYNLIKYSPNKDFDDYFKRILLKLCELYPYYSKDIIPITKEIQGYRDLLKSKPADTITPGNVLNSLKRFDDTLSTFYNKPNGKYIFSKKIRIINKLLKEPFNKEEINEMPFGKLYELTKQKYEQLTPENKDVFFDIYTSSKKSKPVMEELGLWYSLKEKNLRNIMRQEINQFKSTLKQDVFKDTQKDLKSYITKTNEQLQKDIRAEVQETLSGSVIDRLRFITSQSFNTDNFKEKVDNELLANLHKFKSLKDKYKPLIDKYEQAKDSDKINIRKEIQNALYELTPLYNLIKSKYKDVKKSADLDNKRNELLSLIRKLEDLTKDQLNYLYTEFAKYSHLFTNKKQLQDKIDKVYTAKIKSTPDLVLTKELKQFMFDMFKKEDEDGTNYILTKDNSEFLANFIKKWNKKVRDIVNYYHFDKDLIDKYQKYDKLDLLYEEWANEFNTQAEAKEAERKAQEEANRKAQEAKVQAEKEKEKEEEIKPPEIEYSDDDKAEFTDAEEIQPQENNGVKGFNDARLKRPFKDKIPNAKDLSLNELFEKINKHYGKLKENKVDSIIYYYLHNRNIKHVKDFNKYYISNLKKYDKKYNNPKYKRFMKEKKYNINYVDEISKGAFIGWIIKGIKSLFGKNESCIKGSGPILNFIKGILGFNENALEEDKVKGRGLISTIANFLGLSDKALEDDIKGSGLIGTIANFLGLSDEVFEQNEDLKKLKPMIDLLKKEKDNKKVDAYIYAITKIENEDDSEEEIKDKFYEMLYKYDERIRPTLFKKRIKKDYYNAKGGFAPLIPIIATAVPSLVNGIANLISSIKGKGCEPFIPPQRIGFISRMSKNKLTSSLPPKDGKGIKAPTAQELKGGRIMSLDELKELKNQIKN